MDEVRSEILIKQSEIITELAEFNRHLIELLSQYIDIDEENEKLKEIIKKENCEVKNL